MQERIFTIRRLADAAGVTPRTIRYYTVEGLLPPPDTRGRYARYTEAHLQRLQLIARWKQSYLPLHVIRERLAGLTAAQIAALITPEEENPARIDGETSAKATSDARFAEGRSEGHSLEATETQSEDFLLQLLSEAGVTDKHEALPAILPRRRRVLLISPLVADTDAVSEREEGVDRDATFILENALSETWRRVALAPGVELHIRLPQSPDAYAHLDRMIAETQAIFKSLR